MPARSEEEKARRKAEYLERVAARKASREIVLHSDSAKSTLDDCSSTYNSKKNSSSTSSSPTVCYFNILPEDTIHIISCFLPARELGALSLTCKALNTTLKEGRMVHLLSRLNHTHGRSCIHPAKAGHSMVALKLCRDPADARVRSF